MTSEEMKNIIIECSGMAGEIEYDRLSKRDFVEWFTNNIQYNGEESKAKGMEVVEILKEEISVVISALVLILYAHMAG